MPNTIAQSMLYSLQACYFNFYQPIDMLQDIITSYQVTINKTNIKFCLAIDH